MNRDLLLQHFDRMSNAPEAISHFRQFVIELGVRGKLTEQDDVEGTGAELLLKLRQRKLQLMTEKCIRSDQRVEHSILRDETNLPQSWAWAFLDDFALVQGGKRLPNGTSFSKEPTDHVYIRVTDMKDGTVSPEDLRYISPEVQKAISKYTIDQDDLYITIAGTIGQVGRIPSFLSGQNLTENAAKIVFRGIDPDYLRMALTSSLVQQQFRDKTKQMAQPKLALKRILGVRLPIPPELEQRRIVSKVDELMVLCDQLEAARGDRELHRDRVTIATLHHLNDPESVSERAAFFINHLATLTATPSQIKKHRETILDLAVRGRLVPHDSGDEPSHTLLARIQNRRDVQSRAKGDQASPPMDGDRPFALPTGWVWARLQQLLEAKRDISYGVIKLGDEPKNGGVFTLRCSDVKSRCLDLTGVRRVSDEIERNYLRTRLNGGELLLNIRGTLGGVALVPPSLKGYNVAREVAVIPISEELEGQYLVNVMASPYFWNAILGSLRGIAYKGLNLGLLRLFESPLPPLAEQRRIVTKVDELMAICDRLENQLTLTETGSRRLLEAVLHDALSPTASDVEAA